MLGEEGDDCETLTLSGPLDKIEASVTQTETLTFKLNSIRYVKSPNQRTYGTFIKPFSQEWEITEEKPVIGLFGLTNPLENTVVQMGVIFLDTEC